LLLSFLFIILNYKEQKKHILFLRKMEELFLADCTAYI
jgi:hypothetical protein